MLKLVDVMHSDGNFILNDDISDMMKVNFKIINKSKFLYFDRDFELCNECISDNLHLYIWYDLKKTKIRLLNFLLIDEDNGIVHKVNISSYFKIMSYYMKMNIEKIIFDLNYDYKKIKKIIYNDDKYKMTYVLR